MPKHEFNNKDLTPGEVFLIRGRTSYSHISRLTTDDERAKMNQGRIYPIDKNYTKIALYNAQVLCRDPQHPTIGEKYAAERMYASSNPKTPGANYNAINKSQYLPRVGVLNPTPDNPQNYDTLDLDGRELANDLDVTIVMRAFAGGGSVGVSLDAVLVNEPVRFYESRDIANALKAYGIVMAPADTAPAAAPADASAYAAPAAPVAPAPAQQFAAPMAPQAAAPVAPPVAGNPFTSFQGNQFGAGSRQY
jgi:hypothetical protein